MRWLRARRPGPAGAAFVLATLVVLVAATLSTSLFGGKVFTSGDNIYLWAPFSAQRPAHWERPSNPILTDPLLGFNPDLLQTRADLTAGGAALWNPDAGAGRPLLASQVHAPLFPITWLAFLLPFWRSLAWIAAAKLLLAAGGTYLLCRELALRRAPALLGAIAFAWGAYYFAWLEHPQTNVWALLPWMLLATGRVCATGSLGATALLGLASGVSWLGGHPESAGFLLLAALSLAAYELIWERRAGVGWRGVPPLPRSGPAWTGTLAGRAGLVVGALALGLGVGAVVNLPLLELLHVSPSTQRGGPPIPIQEAWGFVFPELWGNPSKAFNAAGPANWAERTAYIGALPLLLAVASLGRRRPREQWFFAGAVVILMATIFHTPLWASGIRHLPGGNTARLERLLVIVTLAGAVLGAFGLQRWIQAGPRERRQMLVMMSLTALAPLLLWLPGHLSLVSSLWTALTQLPAVHPSQTSPRVYALAAVWRWTLLCALGIAVLALLRRRRPATLAVGLVLALTAADLVTLARGFHGSIPLSQANPPVPASIRYLQRHQGNGRVTVSAALPANLGQRFGLRDPRVGIDIPHPARYDALWTGLGGLGGDQEFFVAQSPQAHRLADLFATRYVLLSPTEAVPAWLHPVLRTPGGTVAANPTALPRAWVAYDWQPAPTRAAALARTLAGQPATWWDAPVIERAPAAPAGAAPPATPAQVTRDGAENVTVTALARQPGYLVLDDSAYPGWRASLDGRPVAWAPANENFRAVAIPAGRHTVAFNYRPTSVLAGSILAAGSLAALTVVAGLGAALSRRSRPRPRRSPGPEASGDPPREPRGEPSVTG